jgi:hypothetical protein
LADTGGAFIKNLYQLDLFAGIFTKRMAFLDYLKKIPATEHAYLLYRD